MHAPDPHTSVSASAPITSSDTNALTFHKDFAPPDLIVLQSNHDICFNFDLARLCRHSAFFKDLDSVPRSNIGSWTGPVLPIPISSDAIKMILDTINFKDGLMKSEPRFPTPDDDLLDDIVRFIDMFDCPVVPAFYGEWIHFHGHQFALAAVAGDIDTIKTMIHKMIPLKDEYAAGEAWWARTLADRAPKVHTQLGLVYDNWKRKGVALKSTLLGMSTKSTPTFSKPRCARNYTRANFGLHLERNAAWRVCNRLMASALTLLDLFDDPDADDHAVKDYVIEDAMRGFCYNGCKEVLRADLVKVLQVHSVQSIWDALHIRAKC